MKVFYLLLTCFLLTFNQQIIAQGGAPDIAFGLNGKVVTDFNAVPDVAYAVAIQDDNKIVVAGTSREGYNYDFAISRYNEDGTLDMSFGVSGKVVTDFDQKHEIAYGLVIQPDGKIIAAGSSAYMPEGDFALARYNTDGTLDNSFGFGGKVTTDLNGENDQAKAIVLQPDGKIIVAGYTNVITKNEFAVVRYNSDGSLDSSFGTNGIKTTAFGSTDDVGYAATLQTDGKILVAGRSLSPNDQDFAIVRFLTDGSLDTSFGTIGKITTDFGVNNDQANAIMVQPDGKIVVAGFTTGTASVSYDFALARYNADGTLDTGFSSDGQLMTDFSGNIDAAKGVAIQADGKIVAAGFSVSGSYNDFGLARYNDDGTLDSSFGTNGKLSVDIGSNDDAGTAIAIQDDHNIVVVGNSYNGVDFDFAVARFQAGIVVGDFELISSPSVSVFPNPVQKKAKIQFNFDDTQEVSIWLTDLQGKVVDILEETVVVKPGNQNISVALPDGLTTGNYILVVSGKKGNSPVMIFKK